MDHINLASFHMEYRIIIVTIQTPSDTGHGNLSFSVICT